MTKTKHRSGFANVIFSIIALLIICSLCINVSAATVEGTYTYSNLADISYTYTNGQTGKVSVSGDTFTLQAKGTNATSGCNASPAVSSTATLTIKPNQNVKITATVISGTVTAGGVALGKETQVKSGTEVTFSVTANNATQASATLQVVIVEDTTNTAPDDCARYFIAGSPNDLYYYLDEAIEATKQNDGTYTGTVVVTSSGTVYHSGHADTTPVKDITIPAGVTLLLPYSTNDLTIKSGTSQTNDFRHANVQFTENEDKSIVVSTEAQMNPELDVLYTLVIPNGTTVTVNGASSNPGKIVVGGTILGSQGTGTAMAEGLCYGDHSNLVVDGTLNLGDCSILSAVGYVLGNGNINATGKGAELYQPMVIHDWRGGRAASVFAASNATQPLATQSGESQICPFFQWGSFNIQPQLTMKGGNWLYLYASLYDEDAYCSHSVLVGPEGTGLVQLSDNTILTSKYEDITWGSSYKNGFPGRNSLTISGNAKMGSLSLKAQLTMGSIDVNTANYTLPICYAYSITLDNGIFSIDNPMSLLPGAKIQVNNEATLKIGENSDIRFMVFDGLNQRLSHSIGSAFSPGSAITSPYEQNARGGSQKNKLYPTTAELQAATVAGSKMSADAELIISGNSQLVIGAKANFGGLIQTDGTGTIVADGTKGTTSGTSVQPGVVGGGGKTINAIAAGGIAGMSLHERTAQIISPVTGKPVDILRGHSYIGKENSYTQETYSFKYYPDSSNVNSVTQIDDHPLGETIRGAWEHIHGDDATAEVTRNATCTEAGVTSYTCSVCGATWTKDLPAALTHQLADEAGKPATCTDAGYTAHKKCTREGCDYTEDKTVLPALKHDYTSTVTTKPTCTVAGVKTFTCQRSGCGHTYTEAIDATGHSYEAGEVIAPTCTADGYTIYTCSGCGSTEIRDTQTAAGHSYQVTDSQAATCLDDGYKTYTCGGCGDSYTETLTAAGHSYTSSVTTQPTCTDEGVTTYTCSCGYSYTEPISATGHDWVDGVCQKDNSHQCPGHEFDPETDICKICKLGCKHESWTAGEVVAPTCTEDGYTVYTCDLCQKQKQDDSIAAVGHSWKEATCTAPKTCSVCGATEGSKLDHTPGEARKENEVPPTCANGGSYDSVVYCSRCNDELSRDTITTSATGIHSYGSWSTSAEATYSSFATQTRTCTICNTATETQHPDSAKIGETSYSTLSLAVDAAAEGDTVTLLAHISGDCVISKTLTIEKNGHTANITAGDGYMADGDSAVTIWKLFKLAGTSVKVEDGLHIFFYVNNADKKDGYVAHITRTKLVKDSTNNYTVETTETAEPIPSSAWSSYSGGQLWRFSYDGIAAKEMTDIVTVIIRDSNGKQVSAVATESIEGYALRTLEKIKDQQNLRNAVISMVNYGADAQIHFGYRTLETDHLANANLTDLSEAEIALYGKTVSATDQTASSGSIGLGGTTVTAEANLYLTFYFKDIAETKDNLTACISYTDHYNRTETITIPGSSFVSVKNSDGETLYGPRVTGIAMADGRALITCELKNGDTTLATAVSSVESYAAYNLVHSTNEALKAVCNNMINFVDYVKAYFDNPKA